MKARLTVTVLLLCVVVAGCGASRSIPVNPTVNPPVNPPTVSAVSDDSGAQAVLYQFADLVSKGEVKKASQLLAPGLRGVYEMEDYLPMRNTPKMEIVKLVEETGSSSADFSAVPATEVINYHVYYMEVRYKVLGLFETRLVDGQIAYHKVTVLNTKLAGPMISEISQTQPRG